MPEELSATRTTECAICCKPMELEAAKTDERGMAVHEDCYWTTLKTRRGCDANGRCRATPDLTPKAS